MGLVKGEGRVRGRALVPGKEEVGGGRGRRGGLGVLAALAGGHATVPMTQITGINLIAIQSPCRIEREGTSIVVITCLTGRSPKSKTGRTRFVICEAP